MTDETRWDLIARGDVRIPANDTLGFAIGETTDARDHIALSWTVPPEYCNSAGNLQGGVLAAFVDALLGGAAAARLPAESYPALAEMKISILRPAPAGSVLRGRGRVLKAGARVLFVEAEVTYDRDVLIAKASGTEIPAHV